VRRAFDSEIAELGKLDAFVVMGYSSNDCPALETLVPVAPLSEPQRDDFLGALSRITPVVDAPLSEVATRALDPLYEADLDERFDAAERILLVVTDDVSANPMACGQTEPSDLSLEIERLWTAPNPTRRPTLVVLAIPGDEDARSALRAWPAPFAGEIADCSDPDRCESHTATSSLEEVLRYWLSSQPLSSPDRTCTLSPSRELGDAELSAIEFALTPYESNPTEIVATETDDCSLDELGWKRDGDQVVFCPELCDAFVSTLNAPGATVSLTYLCVE
jgi:hypothetical protein